MIKFLTKRRKKKQKPLKDENNNTQKVSLEESDNEDVSLIHKGTGSIFDIISPDGIDLSHDDKGYIMDNLAEKRALRSFYITKSGWPRKLQTGWIDNISDIGEVDVSIYITKIPPADASKSLTRMITMLNSNLRQEIKRDNHDQISDINTKIHDSQILKDDIALGQNDMFHVAVLSTLYADNESLLKELANLLIEGLKGSGTQIRSTFRRMQEGFLSVLPRGKNELKDVYRNLDRRSLATIFPFASSELPYTGGVPFALNNQTGNMIFLDVFNRKFNNYNICVFGESGSGKTFAIRTLVARSMLKGKKFRAFILDPEGEFKKFTKRLGGVYLKLSPEYPVVLNPCAIGVTEIELDEEDEELKNSGPNVKIVVKDDGKEYLRFVPLSEKINELIGFFDIMAQGKQGLPLDNYEENYIEQAIIKAYQTAGITTDPDSLYEESEEMIDGKITINKVLKPEVTLTDIFKEYVKLYENDPKAQRLLVSIPPWLRGGHRPMFDGQSYFGEGVSTNLEEQKIVTIDISELEEGSVLRRLGYHVTLTWGWQKFIKNIALADMEKIFVSDEFWQNIDDPHIVNVMERIGRRCRKRNTSFVIGSQDAERILDNPKAKGVVLNSSIQMLFKQSTASYDSVKKAFKLSQGELSVVMNATEQGEGLLRAKGISVWMKTDPFEYERVLFESNQAHLKEMQQQIVGR